MAEIAYCYHMVFYTREEAGVAKSPPLHFANSRQYAKYKMCGGAEEPASAEAAPRKPSPLVGVSAQLERVAMPLGLLGLVFGLLHLLLGGSILF